jgi:hypothetical protein
MNRDFRKPNATVLLLLFLAACVVAFYLWFPLDWGLMDDSEYVLGIRKHLEAGWLEGTKNRILEHASIDLRTGIFRPSFWWYTALAYQLPVRLAYFSRFLEYLVIVLSAYSLFALGFKKYSSAVQRAAVLVSLAAVFSIRSLYEGIALFSLQEFTGLFFVALGYWIYANERSERISLKNTLLVFLLLAVGIGFKPPFVWVYFLFASGLFFFERRRLMALVIAAIGVGYFLFTMRLAQSGFYSQEIYQFSWARIFQSLLSFGKHILPVFVVLAAISSFLFRGKLSLPTKLQFSRIQWIGLQIFGAGAMYMATMLPRGIANSYGYYFGPPIFLLTVGFFLTLTIFLDRMELREKQYRIAGCAIIFSVAIFIFAFSMKSFVQRNLAVDYFKKWARENNREEIILATNSYEVAFRLRDIYFLNYGEFWKGQVKNLTHNSPYPQGATHYLVFSDQVEPRRSAMGEIVWEKGSAKLMKISNEN